MPNTDDKNINYQMRILYALGMIFIVAGHSWGGGLSLFYDWFPVYGFHLALFIFASGYFYKEESEDNAVRFILKKIKRLIIPLYLWNLFYGLLVTVMHSQGFKIGANASFKTLFLSPIYDGHQFSLNLPGWFVIPLFMIQVYNVLMRKLIKRVVKSINEYIWFLFNLMLGVLGIVVASKGYNTGVYLVIVRMLFLLPYYSLGYLYKVRLEKKDNVPGYIYFGIILIAELVIAYVKGKIPTYTPSWCNDFNDGPVLPIIVALLGIAFWLRVSRMLVPALKNSKVVKLIADNTFSIMINQYLGFMVIKTLFMLCNKAFGLFKDFNYDGYHIGLTYFYLPKNDGHFLILYLIGGIAVPIIMQLIVSKVYKFFKKRVVVLKEKRIEKSGE